LEAFHKLLGNCGGCLNALCLEEESSCPDPIALFQWFIGEVFHIGRAFHFDFILFIIILYEGQKGAHLTGIYLHSVFPLHSLLCSAFCLTANAAARKALGGSQYLDCACPTR